jgi:hypothetical protein
MTIKTYRRIGNIAFGFAIAAVLSFDAFKNHWIPGGLLIGAGLVALTINTLARFVPLEIGIMEEVASEQPPSVAGEAVTDDPAKKQEDRHAELIERMAILAKSQASEIALREASARRAAAETLLSMQDALLAMAAKDVASFECTKNAHAEMLAFVMGGAGARQYRIWHTAGERYQQSLSARYFNQYVYLTRA